MSGEFGRMWETLYWFSILFELYLNSIEFTLFTFHLLQINEETDGSNLITSATPNPLINYPMVAPSPAPTLGVNHPIN